MYYMNNITGQGMNEADNVRQALRDILTTVKGSRVMLPDYGTNIYKLLDRPVSQSLISDIRMEVAEAIDKYEPRVEVINIGLDMTAISNGIIVFNLKTRYLPSGIVMEFNGLEIVYRSIET